MIVHILGWSTVVSQVVLATWLSRYLYRVGTRPWSWQQPVRAPKLAAGVSLSSSGGSDYVGSC